VFDQAALDQFDTQRGRRQAVTIQGLLQELDEARIFEVLRASAAMPAFPGTHDTEMPEARASVRTSACSRPPEPMTRSFTGPPLEAKNGLLFHSQTILVTYLLSIVYSLFAEGCNDDDSSSAFLPKNPRSCDSLTHSVELFGPYRGHCGERASVGGADRRDCS
jgi:hypothetical protein